MKKLKRILVKVGTRVLTSEDNKLDPSQVRSLVSQICDIQERGIKVLLVTSGAIASGMELLGIRRRPASLSQLQAVASIGQNHLMDVYTEFFKKRGYKTGQVLLTNDDFGERKRYLNIKYTLNTLLDFNAIPVINENDTVSTDEIKCGDNDRLSSLVADLAQVDMFVMLTDVCGLLDEEGRIVRLVEGFTPQLKRLARANQCEISTGGMTTKLEAAKRAVEAGIECVIANGKTVNILLKIIDGEADATVFKPKGAKFKARKRWIAFSSRVKGVIAVDDGATRVLIEKNRSLLPSGITGVSGTFEPSDVVEIVDRNSRVFARGITRFSSEELKKIKGMKTSQIKSVLARRAPDEVVHKDSLVIIL